MQLLHTELTLAAPMRTRLEHELLLVLLALLLVAHATSAASILDNPHAHRGVLIHCTDALHTILNYYYKYNQKFATSDIRVQNPNMKILNVFAGLFK